MSTETEIDKDKAEAEREWTRLQMIATDEGYTEIALYHRMKNYCTNLANKHGVYYEYFFPDEFRAAYRGAPENMR